MQTRDLAYAAFCAASFASLAAFKLSADTSGACLTGGSSAGFAFCFFDLEAVGLRESGGLAAAGAAASPPQHPERHMPEPKSKFESSQMRDQAPLYLSERIALRLRS